MPGRQRNRGNDNHRRIVHPAVCVAQPDVLMGVACRTYAVLNYHVEVRIVMERCAAPVAVNRNEITVAFISAAVKSIR